MLGAGITVALADDTVLLREGIARLLADAGFEVVAQSGNADDLLRHVAMHKPTSRSSTSACRRRTRTRAFGRHARSASGFPDDGVLVLSQYVEAAYAMDLFADSAEGVGYLLKDRVADVDEFATAVRRVADGGSALDPAVVGAAARPPPPATTRSTQLTPREREVLELMAEGRSNQAIADRMFVTLRAVEKHVTSIFAKLDLPATTDDHRRVLAVLAFLQA